MLDAIKQRRSIRKFLDTDIDKSDLVEIIQAGLNAPSAKNRQPWLLVVLTGKDKDIIAFYMREYVRLARTVLEPDSSIEVTAETILQAPILILVFQNYGLDWSISDTLSTGAFVENMLLEARDRGIGSLWIRDTYVVSDEINDQFGRDGYKISCAVALGHTRSFPPATPRKSIKEIVDFSHSKYGG